MMMLSVLLAAGTALPSDGLALLLLSLHCPLRLWRYCRCKSSRPKSFHVFVVATRLLHDALIFYLAGVTALTLGILAAATSLPIDGVMFVLSVLHYTMILLFFYCH
jgi:hypothetical protein